MGYPDKILLLLLLLLHALPYMYADFLLKLLSNYMFELQSRVTLYLQFAHFLWAILT